MTSATFRRWSVAMGLFALLYAVVTLLLADLSIQTGLDMDRYAFMESLVERGEYRVDSSSMQSVDRIRIGEHFYSGKPPVMNFLGAGVYWGLHRGLGWSFRENPAQVVRVMIAIFVSLPTGLLLLGFWRVVSRVGQAAGLPEEVSTHAPAVPEPTGATALRHAVIATLLLAFASLLLPYTRIFTNHPLAAALLFGAFALNLRGGERRAWARGFGVGFLAALSATIDLIPGTFYLAGAGVVLLGAAVKSRSGLSSSAARTLGGMIAGALVPAAAHLILNRITLGTWSTSYFVQDAFNYEGSIWTAEFDAADYDQFPTYWSALYHYVLGHRSVLLMCPLLLFGAWHAGRPALRRGGDPEGAGRAAAAWGALAAFVAVLLLVPKYSMGLAGGVYGPRHILPVLPLLYAWLPAELGAGQTRGLLRRILFWALALWSALIAWIGMLVPWTPHTMSAYAPLDVIAIQLARRGETEVAGQIIRTTAPNPSFGYQEMGAQLWGHGHRELALHAYVQSLKLQPTRTKAMYAAGVLAGEMNRLELSARMFRSLVELEPDNAGAWANLGVTLLAMGDAQEGRPALERALKLNPKSRAALQGLMRLHAAAGEKEQARALAERLLEVDPRNSFAREVLGGVP